MKITLEIDDIEEYIALMKSNLIEFEFKDHSYSMKIKDVFNNGPSSSSKKFIFILQEEVPEEEVSKSLDMGDINIEDLKFSI